MMFLNKTVKHVLYMTGVFILFPRFHLEVISKASTKDKKETEVYNH